MDALILTLIAIFQIVCICRINTLNYEILSVQKQMEVLIRQTTQNELRIIELEADHYQSKYTDMENKNG